MKKILALLLLAASSAFANPWLVCPTVTSGLSNTPSTYTVSGLPNSPITSNAVTITSGTVQLDLDLGLSGQAVPYGTYTVSATASNSSGTSASSANLTLNVPEVTVQAASSVGSTTATLNGDLLQDGGTGATSEGFLWGTSTSYGNTVTITAGEPYTSGTFSSNLTGLTAGTTYHYQAWAANANCSDYSADQTFTTSSVSNNALVLNGSSQALSNSSAFISSYPYSMACWVKVSSTSTGGTMMAVGSTSTSNEYFTLGMASGGDVSAWSDQGGGAQSLSASAMSTGTWHLAVAVFTSATSRTAYLDGVAGTTNTTSKSPSGMGITSIGDAYTGTGTPVSYFPGDIAYPTFWNVALTSTDVTNLWNSGSGVNPSTIESSSVVSYSPFQGSSPWSDGIGAGTWTAAGSPTTTTPPF